MYIHGIFQISSMLLLGIPFPKNYDKSSFIHVGIKDKLQVCKLQHQKIQNIYLAVMLHHVPTWLADLGGNSYLFRGSTASKMAYNWHS